jgi:hypothetical protein
MITRGLLVASQFDHTVGHSLGPSAGAVSLGHSQIQK